MNRRSRVVDVRNRAGRRYCLQVAVVHTVFLNQGLELAPIVLRRNVVVCEQFTNSLRFGSPLLVDVLVEERTVCVIRVLEVVEALASFTGDLHRSANRMVDHGVEVDVREVERFF